MKRRIFSVLLSSALLLTALAGCGQGGEAAPSGSSSDADSETGTRDELIFVNYRDIRDLNPHLYAGEMYAQSILYDTLVSNTEDGYVGCLAEDWTISDDGRIYTFNIRDGVTFSDGTPCDANAILANFNAILENRERHTWLEMMNLLVGVSAPDEDTFVIEMSEPYYPMLTELACIRPFAMISPIQSGVRHPSDRVRPQTEKGELSHGKTLSAQPCRCGDGGFRPPDRADRHSCPAPGAA